MTFAATVAPSETGTSSSHPILAPGRNCWRIEHAKRFALLVDGENYFRAVREAIREAQHSVFVLGWDVDSRMRLVPEGANDGWPEPFADFLDALVRKRKGLRVYVLSWDFAMLYLLEREWLPIYKMHWRTHRRLSFQLDAMHPTGGSHHQKVVVVDDSVGFVSGFDITRSRWDSCEHQAEEPRRRNPFGLTYGPFHDVGSVIEGDCARALGELARERWRRATGTPAQSPLGAFVAGRWPVSTPSDIDNLPVAIARTEPRFGDFEGAGEVRALHLDAIASAQRDIFGENQYFTSKTIADAFEARLVEPQGPDIAIISPAMQSGWLEVSTMGVLRARLHRKLKAADANDRYRLYCPTLPWLDGRGCLNVHSKVLVIDDEFVTVGSANLSDRSMGLDTECNLAIEANGDPRIQQAIRGIRYRLLGEHLDCDPRVVEDAHRDKRLIAAIASLHRDGQRTLASNDPPLDPALDAVVPDHTVLDPEEPIDADRLVADLVSEPETRKGTRQRVFALVGALVLIGILATMWRSTAVREWIDVGQIVADSKGFSRSPLSVVAALGAFVVGGLVLFPVTILIAGTVLVFGPIEGALYAMSGALLSAASTYALGRRLGRDRVRSLAGPRLNKLSRRLAKRGLLAMTLVRLLPVAPFSVVNGVAGASHISWRDFLLGTVLGMTPGIALTAAFIDRAVAVVREPGIDTVAVLIALAALAFALYWPLQKRLGRLPGEIRPHAEHVG